MINQYNLSKVDKLKMILYGAPSSGKTRLIGTMTKHPEIFGHVLVLNAAGNPEILLNQDWLVPQNITILDYKQLNEINDPYTWIEAGQDLKHNFATTFGIEKQVGTFVIDTVTDVQRLVFNAVGGGKNKLLPGNIPSKRQWDDYRQSKYTLSQFAYLLFDLPIHVILTAWENERAGYTVALEGSAANEVPGYSNICVRLVQKVEMGEQLNKLTKAVYNYMLTERTENSYIKVPYERKLPKYITDPEMLDVYKLMIGE